MANPECGDCAKGIPSGLRAARNDATKLENPVNAENRRYTSEHPPGFDDVPGGFSKEERIMKVECYIGIDPGATTGFAAWDARLGEFEEFYSGSFWDVYRKVMDYPKQSTVIILEDPNKNKPVFTRDLDKRSILKVGQNVGMNKRDAQLLLDGFTEAGFTVIQLQPKGGAKGTRRKWTPQTFMNITGHHTGLNEHIRDAAMMVFGRPHVSIDRYKVRMEAS